MSLDHSCDAPAQTSAILDEFLVWPYAGLSQVAAKPWDLRIVGVISLAQPEMSWFLRVSFLWGLLIVV